MFSPTYASQPFAPLVHESGNLLCEKHVSRGNADQAIRDADYVLMYHYETPYTEHAFLEPECAVAYPDEDGLTILSTDQGAYDTAREVSRLLGLPKEKIHVTNMLVGGGFGGKEDMTVQHHAALVAYLTGRPVKVKLSRKESMLVHPKRHPMKVTITMGCNRNGLIQGVKAEVVADTGAYASLGGPVLERACTHAAGPYHYENFEITGKAYYTNNPPAGAFRGFGVTQTCYAMEMTLTKMAHELGISPWEIRYRNAIRPGQTLPNGQIAPPSTGLVETLEAVKDICEQNKNVGIACAMKNAGVGVGIPDTGRCIVAVKDGKLHIRSGASCIGQGLGTVLTQIVCTMLHCEREEVVEERRRDYKTVLQELVQREPNRTLVYRMAEESGPDHDKTFTFEVLLNGAVVGRGEGHSKKEAEQMAARAALERLETDGKNGMVFAESEEKIATARF